MSRRFVVLTAVVAGLFLAMPASTSAQGTPDARQPRAGHVAPIVDDSTLKQSAHAKLVCVACHTGLDPANIPYRGKIEPVACLRCHADAQFKHPFHPEVAQSIRDGREPRVSCKDCHGAHDVVSPKVPGSKFYVSRITESCGKCHQKALDAYRGSAHGKALAADAKGAPTCLACHRKTITFAPVGDSASVKSAQAQVCQSCHLDRPDVRERMSAMAGFIAPWDSSTHGVLLQNGKAAAANCVSCHGSHGIRKKTEPGSTVGRDSLAATCAKCHAATEQKFNQSVHGTARTSSRTDSMTCATCHGEHAKLVVATAESGAPLNAVPAQACARCHDAVALSGKYGISSERFRNFTDSYHGLEVRNGTVEAANCASCHGAHDVKPKSDSTSRVNTANRVANCGRCHPRARERFDIAPVHGKAGAIASPGLGWRAPLGIALIAGLAGGLFLFGRRRRAST